MIYCHYLIASALALFYAKKRLCASTRLSSHLDMHQTNASTVPAQSHGGIWASTGEWKICTTSTVPARSEPRRHLGHNGACPLRATAASGPQRENGRYVQHQQCLLAQSHGGIWATTVPAHSEPRRHLGHNGASTVPARSEPRQHLGHNGRMEDMYINGACSLRATAASGPQRENGRYVQHQQCLLAQSHGGIWATTVHQRCLPAQSHGGIWATTGEWKICTSTVPAHSEPQRSGPQRENGRYVHQRCLPTQSHSGLGHNGRMEDMYNI